MKNLSRSFKRWFFARENTLLGRQRLLFFASVALASIMLTVASFFVSHQTTVQFVADGISMALTLGLAALYACGKIRIRWAATALYILIQLNLSVHKMVFALEKTPESAGLIVQESFLSLLLIMVSILSVLRYSPTLISAISLFTFSFCVILFPTTVLYRFAPVYLIVLIGAIVYDMSGVRPFLHTEADKNDHPHPA